MEEKIEYLENEKAFNAEDITSDNESSTVFVKSIEERAYLRKLNWTVLPLIFLVVFIQVRIFI